MTVVEAIRARLLAQSPVTAMVSQRVWSQVVPQSPVYPLVLVELIDDDEPMQLRGTSGLVRARVQVGSRAKSRVTAIALGEAVHGDGATTGLCAFKGDIGSPPFVITGVLPAGKREGFDPVELNVFTVSRDYFVWFKT